MTTATELITAGFRESNLIPVGKTPTVAEQAEGLQVLNRYLDSAYGFVVGENLADWSVPAIQRTGSVAANAPLLPGSNPSSSRCQPAYPPANTRIVWDGSEQTVYFPERPHDGARMALVQSSGASASGSGTLTLDGNGRTIEGAATYTGGVSGRRWLYRGDLADWKALPVLALTDECPFPADLDDYWICCIAIRLAPRFGKTIQPATTATFSRMEQTLRARYAQESPGTSGGARLQTGHQSFDNGWYFP